jgi:type I restriction enzyme, S subunit
MQVRPLGQGSVPVGYKQTEVGVIPEDWVVRRLDEGIKLMSGHHVLAQYCNTDGDGVAYITGPADFPDGVIQHSKYTARPGAICSANDILVTVKGSGAGTLVLSDAAYCISRQLMAIRVHSWSTPFVYFSLLRDSSLFGAAATGLIPGLSRSDILNKTLPLPPTKTEQEAIAEALSDADALIDSLEQLLAKKRQLKQGAMQELLTGKKRLPGFSGEWEVKRLKECLVSPPDYGINAPAVLYSDRLPTYIRITDISEDGRFAPDVRVSVAHPDAERYYLSAGDLVFARTGASVGKSYLYNPCDGPLVFAGFLIRVRPDSSRLSPAFLSNFVQTRSYWNWVQQMSMRSGQPGINGNEFAQLLLLRPSVAEQTAIATILSDIDAEIAALQAKLAKARQLKEGMMQELLTGRIRLV